MVQRCTCDTDTVQDINTTLVNQVCPSVAYHIYRYHVGTMSGTMGIYCIMWNVYLWDCILYENITIAEWRLHPMKYYGWYIREGSERYNKNDGWSGGVQWGWGFRASLYTFERRYLRDWGWLRLSRYWTILRIPCSKQAWLTYRWYSKYMPGNYLHKVHINKGH